MFRGRVDDFYSFEKNPLSAIKIRAKKEIIKTVAHKSDSRFIEY